MAGELFHRPFFTEIGCAVATVKPLAEEVSRTHHSFEFLRKELLSIIKAARTLTDKWEALRTDLNEEIDSWTGQCTVTKSQEAGERNQAIEQELKLLMDSSTARFISIVERLDHEVRWNRFRVREEINLRWGRPTNMEQ